jgi:hypothetical protein
MTTFALNSFDHYSNTGFSLQRHLNDYNGTAMTCDACHLNDRFSREMIDCRQCHAEGEPEFMGSHIVFFGEECLKCHDGIDSMSDFSHSTVFVLDGAHKNLECDACHLAPISDGTPIDCVGCHQEPEIHAGLFGLDCVRCHSTAAWLPAHLSQHTFPIDHGDQGKVECQVCHVASYAEYTCYGCHEHTPDEIREEHVEEGIVSNEIENCIACHPTGKENE